MLMAVFLPVPASADQREEERTAYEQRRGWIGAGGRWRLRSGFGLEFLLR